jgi:RNA polymerase sigma factor (sigma-70 family)
MPKRQALTQDEFDRLLAWLDPDPLRAGGRYEDIRRSLIKIFNWRGCADAEDMADEVINRVARHVHKFEATYVGDAANYFYGVGRKLLYEYQRQSKEHVPLDEAVGRDIPAPEPEEGYSEAEHKCLARCVGKLDAASRELIMAYYALDRENKIEGRRLLAERFGISVNNMRVKVYRIRAALEKCIRECLE